MTARRQAVARRTARHPVLTLTQRIERLERQHFQQKPAPGPRFTVQGDVVQDNVTGLMWTRKSIGKAPWAAAADLCAACRVGGFTDWRFAPLPELLTIVDYSRTAPAIAPVFECESSAYWAATPYAPSPGDCAWYVAFSSGYATSSHQGYECFVRAVRPGLANASERARRIK